MMDDVPSTYHQDRALAPSQHCRDAAYKIRGNRRPRRVAAAKRAYMYSTLAWASKYKDIVQLVSNRLDQSDPKIVFDIIMMHIYVFYRLEIEPRIIFLLRRAYTKSDECSA